MADLARFGRRADDTPHAEHGDRHGPPPSALEAALTPSLARLLEHIESLHRVIASSAAVARRGALASPARDGRVRASAGTLAGWSVHETTGTAGALVRLRDGTDAAGDVLAVLSLAAGATETRWLLPHGIGFVNGLYVEVAAGAVEGAVYTGPWA